jgi:hypothetical protein
MILKRMTIENFILFFKKYRYFPEEVYFNKNKAESFTDKDYNKYYNKYLEKIQKKENKLNENKIIKIDEDWENCKRQVDLRDPDGAEFLNKLTKFEKKVLTNKIFSSISVIDYAHIFEKSKYPSLKYDPDNIIKLPRLVHSSIDHNKDWVTDKFISKEDKKNFWIRFIGKNKYNNLLNKINKVM